MTTATANRTAILRALAAGPLTFGELAAIVCDTNDPEEPLATVDELSRCMAEELVEPCPGEESTRYRLTSPGRAGLRNAAGLGGVP